MKTIKDYKLFSHNFKEKSRLLKDKKIFSDLKMYYNDNEIKNILSSYYNIFINFDKGLDIKLRHQLNDIYDEKKEKIIDELRPLTNYYSWGIIIDLKSTYEEKIKFIDFCKYHGIIDRYGENLNQKDFYLYGFFIFDIEYGYFLKENEIIQNKNLKLTEFIKLYENVIKDI